jgi:4-hydroxy-3-methylbut-2-enyl diphosphate reductase
MSIRISVHKKSGFCFGVKRAVDLAEEHLDRGEQIYCLGKIVHNPVEVKRLAEKGLVYIDYEEFNRLKDAKVLIRAHGEPPRTYKIAERNGIRLIDASCPIVLKLQDRIREAAVKAERLNAWLLIFGKKDHPEARALVGQSGNRAIVFQDMAELGHLDFTRKFFLFSQTTMDPEQLGLVAEGIRSAIRKAGKDPEDNLILNDTICRHVSHRKPDLLKFASEHQLLLFVSGRESSNGRTLFAACRTVNPNAHFISDTGELENIDLDQASSIGICGATSTPFWLLEKVELAVKERV